MTLFPSWPRVSRPPSSLHLLDFSLGFHFSLTNLGFSLHSTRSLLLSIFIENLIPQRFLKTCKFDFDHFIPISQSSAQNLENIGLCFRLHPLSWERSLRAFCVHPSEVLDL
ncbi:unnamed protein product [Malus baccata var. baccata]